MSLSRRHFLAGLGALALSGCASASSSTSGARMARQRPKATPGPVMNPADLGLNAVIDLNHHNAIQDLSVAQLYGGLRGVIHKASEGNDWVDPLYVVRRDMAAQAGLLWGGYHFGTRQHSGAEQARFFLQVTQAAPGTLLALDLELNERVPGNSMTLDQAEDFVHAVYAATGRLPLLYVQPAWADGEVAARSGQSLNGAIAEGSILAACDLWLADYRVEPELPSAWAGRSWRFWQYAGDGPMGGQGPFGPLSRSLPGVERCDRNVFAGDEAALTAYWAGEVTARTS